MSCPPDSAPALIAARSIRLLLIGVLWLGLIGTVTDLLLLNHVESWTQLIPMATLAVATVALLAAMMTAAPAAVRAFQVAMLLVLITGGLGMYLHYRGNAEFQLEIDPSLSGVDLLWKSLRAKSPPALAPGSMIQLSLVGLALSLLMPTSRTSADTPSRTPPTSGALS